MAHTVNGSSESSGESLNGSWVKLEGSFRNGNSPAHSPVASEDGVTEDLIAEAVADHNKHSSRSSSAEKTVSPRSGHSPTHEPRSSHRLKNLPAQEGTADWIWEWSSRVEAQPPKEWKMRHPVKKSRGSNLSIRRTRVMKSEQVKTYLYIIIPSLVVSHLIAFGIGVYIGRKTVDINTS